MSKEESNELIEMLKIIKKQAIKSNNDTAIINIKIDSFNFVIDKAIKALEQESCEELDFVQPHKKMSVNLEVCKMREATQKERDGVARYIDSIAESKTVWIPVSERLPEERVYCLCCNKDGYITVGFISKWSKEWIFDDDSVDIDVIAWMPLPEPYEAESEDKCV